MVSIGTGPAQGGFKVCHAPTADEGRATAHQIWPNQGLPGELAQVLPQPKHFEQFRSYVDAGFDEVHVAQIGPRQDEFFRFWRDKVASRLPR